MFKCIAEEFLHRNFTFYNVFKLCSQHCCPSLPGCEFLHLAAGKGGLPQVPMVVVPCCCPHGRWQGPLIWSHYLWPRKLASEIAKSHNLEAIWTTTTASKLFQTLYLGYNWVLHYIIYGLRLSNFDISSAFTSNWHPWTYPLSSNISSRS